MSPTASRRIGPDHVRKLLDILAVLDRSRGPRGIVRRQCLEPLGLTVTAAAKTFKPDNLRTSRIRRS